MIETLRHLNVFNPEIFGHKRIDVIGIGATGSRIVLSLAKLGIESIHVWDFDEVADVNIANQVYGLEDVGKQKVDALKAIVMRDTKINIEIATAIITQNELVLSIFPSRLLVSA